MQANLSALRLRPWDGVTVALDRLTPFPARVTGWGLAPDGAVNLQLAEVDPAVWAWNPATDERATGQNPPVVVPNPGVIAAPAAMLVETPLAASFAVMAVSWSAVGSGYLAGYEIEFRPSSVAVWQGYAGGSGATAVAIPTAEPTAFRVRAKASSGAVSGWREALVPAAASGLAATGIAGGVRLSGGFPADGVRLQVLAGQQRQPERRHQACPPSRLRRPGTALASPTARPAGTGCAASRPRATSPPSLARSLPPHSDRRMHRRPAGPQRQPQQDRLREVPA